MPKKREVPAWTIRDGNPADVPLLINSWLKSYNEQITSFDRHCGFWEAQKLLIATLLEEPTCRVIVAAEVDPEDSTKDIMGWAVGEAGRDLLLHYVYTKKKWRRAGIGNALVAELLNGCHASGRVITTHEGFGWTREKRERRAWGLSHRGIFYRLMLKMMAKRAA